MHAELLMPLPFVRGSEYLKGKAEIAQPYGRKRSPRNALIIKILKKEKTRVLLLLIMLLQAAMGQTLLTRGSLELNQSQNERKNEHTLA